MSVETENFISPVVAEKIGQVWQKGAEVSLNDPDEWRKDACGNLIQFDKYEKRDYKYGWVMKKIKSTNSESTEEMENLQPVQWEVSEAKLDGSGLDCSVSPKQPETKFD